jgi:hypothetical protein
VGHQIYGGELMSDFAFRNLPSYRKRVLEQSSGTIKKLGKADPYAKTLRIKTGERGRPGQYSGEDAYTYSTVKNPYYISPKKLSKLATQKLQRETRKFRRSQRKIFRGMKSDIADQLKILQEDKTAVSNLMDEYTKMLQDEADAKARAMEEQKVALQTARANAARSSVASGLQIQLGGGVPAFSGGSTPRASGSGQFKRRLNIGQSNMVNI